MLPDQAPGMEGAAGSGITPIAAENAAVGGLGTGLKAGVSMPETYPTPAGAGAAPAPGQPAAAAAAAPGQPASRFAPIMGELAKQGGTGQAMMQLFTRDQQDQATRATQERTLRAEGSKLMLAALKDGDIPMARAHAKQYGLQVPEEVWKNRDVLMGLRTAASLAKTLGIKDDHAVAFSQGFVKARAAGQAEDQAMLAGLALVPKDGFEVKGHFTDDTGNVQFYDKGGSLKASGKKARAVAGGGAGGTATIQNRDDMARRIKIAYPGLDDSVVQKFVINPRAQITPQDVVKVRNALQRQVDGLGRPVYKTSSELDKAAREVIIGARSMAGFALPESPTPPSPTPPGGGPQGATGVRRRFNSQTNTFDEVPAGR